MNAARLYLDLLKRSLTNWIYGEQELIPVSPEGLLDPQLLRSLEAWRIVLARAGCFDPEQRRQGRDWPPFAHTMIGLKRLDNLQTCIEDVLEKGIPGDLMETGVWRGGAAIFMRGVLKCYAVEDRVVWAADSFAGLPPPDPEAYPADNGQNLHTVSFLAVSLAKVQANFARYGLLDEQVRFLQGWFRDTLPRAPMKRLAVLRLDGDLYESTMEALVHLYPKLSVGGYLIVDDYGAVPACREAVHDFRQAQGITEEMLPIDGDGVYWRRTCANRAVAWCGSSS